MKKRATVTIGVHSTKDELLSARMLIDELLTQAPASPAAEPRKGVKRPRSLAALDLPTHILNALRGGGVHTLAALMKHSVPSLLHVPGLGQRSINVLQATLAEHGLELPEVTNE